MNMILQFLTKYVYIGFVSSIATVFLSILDTDSIFYNYVKLIGVILGIVIASLTVWAKILDICIKKRKMMQ